MATPVRQGAQLDELLLKRGLIEPEQLEEGRRVAAERGRSLGRVLIELGYLKEGALVAVLADQLGLEFIDLTEVSIDASAITLVPEAVARRNTCIPVRFAPDGRLVVAMADPANVVAVDDLKAIARRDIRTAVATKADVLAAINRLYRLDTAADALAQEAGATAEKEKQDLEAITATASAEDAPIIKLVNLLITQAINDRASDIHIEPDEKSLRRIERSADAKVSPAFGLVWIWLTPGSWYSTGSSTVMMLTSGRLRTFKVA